MLLPALAAAQSLERASLGASKVYHASQIPYEGDDKKKGRAFFRGAEHSGFDLETHETILGAGTEPTLRTSTSTRNSSS